MIKRIILSGLIVLGTKAQADIHCVGKDNSGRDVAIHVRTSNSNLFAEVVTKDAVRNRELTLKIPVVQDKWDGHMTGLFTGEGFAMKYESHYGCIRNVSVITQFANAFTSNFGQAEFSRCRADEDHDRGCVVE